MAVAWAAGAEMLLKKVNGFSPNLFVPGKKVSDVWKLALEEKTTSQIVAENLNALHWTGQNFVIMKHDLN